MPPPPRRKIAAKPSDGLYEEDVAERIGVRRQTVSSWRARSQPKRHPLPKPNGWAADSGKLRPWWRAVVIDEWNRGREGRPWHGRPATSTNASE